MKALLVLALLTLASIANASVDLSCESVKSTTTSRATLIQENGNFTMVRTSFYDGKKFTETHRMYVEGKQKNMIDEMVYWGLAERQTGPDVFEQSRFELRVPNIITNKTTLTLMNVDNEPSDVIVFSCVRPDNR